jgi:hypothetical protein
MVLNLMKEYNMKQYIIKQYYQFESTEPPKLITIYSNLSKKIDILCFKNFN